MGIVDRSATARGQAMVVIYQFSTAAYERKAKARKESPEVGPIVLQRRLGAAECRSSPALANRLFAGRASVASIKVPRL
ncbi:MAG: hypothetical protein DMG56_03355 [Acidobacteria bacterium]|nr:MAG: hypothetical protein DMG54_27555 [Acidobacteriota bacterium]PYU60971.1 MAG: hypothetical protein DMG55_09355 [Acidobacteriota bacterium]PYU65468.1 MAG: hypothetical protein DMG56_03355 [Acidobacteriota bacterium]PYU76288.1 MAG: hypothetical protein DMG52_03955 [Acidobacteriota bacterium]